MLTEKNVSKVQIFLRSNSAACWRLANAAEWLVTKQLAIDLQWMNERMSAAGVRSQGWSADSASAKLSTKRNATRSSERSWTDVALVGVANFVGPHHGRQRQKPRFATRRWKRTSTISRNNLGGSSVVFFAARTFVLLLSARATIEASFSSAYAFSRGGGWTASTGWKTIAPALDLWHLTATATWQKIFVEWRRQEGTRPSELAAQWTVTRSRIADGAISPYVNRALTFVARGGIQVVPLVAGRELFGGVQQRIGFGWECPVRALRDPPQRLVGGPRALQPPAVPRQWTASVRSTMTMRRLAVDVRWVVVVHWPGWPARQGVWTRK